MEIFKQTEINPSLFRTAIDALELHKPDPHEKFSVEMRSTYGTDSAHLMNGYSRSTFRDMKAGKKKIPNRLPYGLVVALQGKGHDVTVGQVLDFFAKLGFDIRFDCSCARNNDDENRFTLSNLRFEIHEANATADDPDNPDFELKLKLGFDRLRLSVHGDGLKTEGNFVACTTHDSPEAEAEGTSDDKGWFRMREVSRDPLAWAFVPKKDGEILVNVVSVAGKVAEISTTGKAPVAVISALREALCVRIVDQVERQTTKALIDEHRDKMCAAVAQKSIGARAPEYVLYSAKM